eukprot:1240837-Ditylum_brightwellii.AAC.1
MVEDKLCNIICQMIKYDWHNDLRKSRRTHTDLSFQDLVNYFEQIKFLNGVKQKLETVVVDDDSDEKKKPSSQHRKNVNSDKKAKGNQSKGSHNSKRT